MTCILQNLAVDASPVLGQIHRAQDIYRKWGQPSDSPGTTIMLILLTVLLSVGAFFIARRLLALLKQASPGTTLFDELAKAHSLSKTDRATLKRIARHEKLGSAAELFVRTGYLETYAKSNTPIYKKLYRKLFLK